MLLVTGASGLLGASVLLLAREQGRGAVGLCHTHRIHVPGLSVFDVDLTDTATTRETLVQLRPAAVVHCAAGTNVDWCEDHPDETERINVHASSFLAAVAAELNLRFVHVSTDSVFDGRQSFYLETDEAAPLNVYAASKLRAEQEVFRHNSSALIVRTNIYGWNVQKKQSLAEWIVGRLAKGKEVPGFVDVYFTPILANDLAEILLAMLDRGLTGVYHVAGSQRVSKYEFAKQAAIMAGFEPERVVPTRFAEARLRAARPLDTSLSTNKVRFALERPIPSMEQGLRRFADLRERGYPQQLKSFLTGAAE